MIITPEYQLRPAASVSEKPQFPGSCTAISGARYYEPTSGRFLSPDPLGHAASASLYDFANGDPVNRFDPDGRLATQFGKDALSGLQQNYNDLLAGTTAFNNYVANFVFGGLNAVNQSLQQQQFIDPQMLAMLQPETELLQIPSMLDSLSYLKGVTSGLNDYKLVGSGDGTLANFADQTGALFPKNNFTPIQVNDVTTYQDFVARSVVGDGLEGHEILQNATLKAEGLTLQRLDTVASQQNPVIALTQDIHGQVSAAQRAFDAATQTPLENINANINILKSLDVVPPSVIEQAKQMAIKHAQNLGY